MMPAPTEITPQQLNRLIGTPNCPVLIDVRTQEDFEYDPRIIPTAIRHDFSKIDALVEKLAGKSTVVICHKGKKLSMGAAAILRSYGLEAQSLEGGNVAWTEAGNMLVPQAQIPNRNKYGNTVWVTRLRPKIDRIACPWLIRRFIDPNAHFLFVPPQEVPAVAEKFDATPFDIDDTFWGHRDEECTFDTMISEWNLNSEPLAKLAIIVRGADTNRHEIAPQASGLVALSLGLSRMYKDDLAQLDAGMVLYDALYRWARDAQNETHEG